MYPFIPLRSFTSFHLVILPLYSTIFLPLGISFVVKRPLPAPFRVDRLTISCFSRNGMGTNIGVAAFAAKENSGAAAKSSSGNSQPKRHQRIIPPRPRELAIGARGRKADPFIEL